MNHLLAVWLLLKVITNLWNYKFTWNPRNVVLAGQGGTAKFIQEGTYKYIPYHKLFRRTEFLNIEGYGNFEAYANRDSLKYREAYGLTECTNSLQRYHETRWFLKSLEYVCSIGYDR